MRFEPSSASSLPCSFDPTAVLQMTRMALKAEVFDCRIEERAKHTPPFRIVSRYREGEPLLNKDFLAMAARMKGTDIPHPKMKG